jgi:signal transduction histidine kinase/DNA-binding NarL/FixJ family response regulator
MTATRVLIVEDNRADARLLTEMLSEVPDDAFAFETVATLAEALARAPAHDVVLLDLSLPDSLGLATLNRMLGVARATPIVVLTGNDDERQATEAVKAGAQDYLLKQEISLPLLVRSIRYAIERKRVELSELERARADLAASRAQFVATAIAEVTRGLDLKTALGGLAQVLVPRLGDSVIIDLVRDDAALVASAQAGYAGPLPDVVRSSSGALHDPVLLAISSRASVWLSELDVDTADERHRLLIEQAGARAIFVAPLIARGGVIGAISCVYGAERRAPDADERRLAEEVASHAALAVDNMRLFEQAQRAVQGRDELLTIVSHDLRNPINVISLALHALEQPDAAQPAQTVPRIKRALKRMEHLINDLLDVARVDAGSLQVAAEPLALAPVLDEVFEQWRPLILQKNIAFSKDYGDSLGAGLIDRNRVAQLLSNLIGNASKFTPSGGTLRMGAELLGPWVKVSISDTGPGIAAENLPHVFDRFWQKERRTDGLGLGLAIAKGIVEAHSGSIHVESALGAGTTFWFTLPRALS